MINEKDLPDGWRLLNLRDVCLNKGEYGSGASAIEYDDNKPRYIRITDIDENGLLKKTRNVSPSIVEDKYFLNDGDLLFARSGSVGKTYLYNKNDGFCQYAGYLIRFKPNLSLIDSNYLSFLTKTPYYWNWINSKKKILTIPNINAKQYSELKIPLPPLPTQKKIVAILEKAEKLRGWRREADELTDELLKSTFLEMFGDPVKNPMGWELMKLNKVGSLQRGKSKHRPRDAPELLGGPHPLIQTGEVSSSNGYIREYHQTYSEIGLSQSKMWPKGTLCITIAANIAKTGILTFNACFPDSIVGFTPYENATTEYVQYWLSFLQKTLENAAPESAQKNINLKILSNLDIPIPPIELQTEFTKIIQHVIEIKEHQTQSHQHIDNLFNALMQQAFRGELTT